MNGVDVGDQLSGYYNIGRRSRKWWKRVFSYVTECSILNSYVLDSHVHSAGHTTMGSGKRDYLAFRLELARELVGTFSSQKRAGRPRSAEHNQVERLKPDMGHWPRQAKKPRRCVVCLAIGKKSGVSKRRPTNHFIPNAWTGA